MFKTAFALLVGTSAVALAAQDSAFYPHFKNPNVKKSAMYYRESVNVLQDLYLGEFDALFIRYHGCVWSEYGSGRKEGGGEDGGDANCGGDGGDEHWYMGRTQCFRPNVAYTLYGVKHGESVPEDGACSQNHYINSFFTSYGLESFGDSIGFEYEDYGAYTSCVTQEGNDDGNQNQNGDGNDREHNEQFYAGMTSYGLACSANGQFVTATFSGAFCEGRHFNAIIDDFSTMNGKLDTLGCTMIFNNGTTFENEYHKAYYNNDDEEANNNNNNGEDYGEIMYTPAWSLLSQSSACSTTQYPNRCPDPFGTKTRRDNALRSSSIAAHRNIPIIMPILTLVMVLIALYFFKLSNDFKHKMIKKSLEEDPMDQARGMGGIPAGVSEVSLVLSQSFARTVTGLSARTRSVKEALIAYAEEEEEDIVATDANGEPVATAEGNEEDADDGVSVISMISKASKTAASAAVAVAGAAAVAAAAAVSADDPPGEKTADDVADDGTVASKAGTVASKAGTVTSKASNAGTVTSDAGTVTISVDGTIATAPAVLSPREQVIAAAESAASQETDDDGVMVQNNSEVANAMLAEKGIVPPRSPEEKKKKKKKLKRPRMAKVTRFLFRGRRKSLAISANRAGA